jgi:signal peptidase I
MFKTANLKLGELKPGDIIAVNDEGVEREGTVVRISHEDHQALVDNGVQEFWYTLDEMHSIPVDETQLLRLGFTKEEVDGGVKYKKDSFRLVTPEKGNFSNIEMWWREDRRHFSFPLGVHQLQNLHLDMTKVPLEKH